MVLPSNAALTAFSDNVPWQDIEQKRRLFNRALESLAADPNNHSLPLDVLSEAVGAPVTAIYDPAQPESGNVLVTAINGTPIVLGSVVSERYHSGHTALESIVPYNLNPSVNHTNITETEDSFTRLRVLGAEVEMGLVHPDGHSPTEDEVHELHSHLPRPRGADRRLSSS